MCGIAGVIKLSGKVEEKDLRLMAELLRHRGPDDVGFFVEENVGLVHTRLSIIDLEGGRQPLFSSDEALVTVANGEIYNFVELRKELEDQGCRFSTRSDCETILHAYRVWGETFLEHLNGMFALALYDRRKRSLILARDRLGIKPLFYAPLADRILFASEIKALIPFLPKVELDPAALVQYLQAQFSSGRQTILQGVLRVLPAEQIEISADLRLRQRAYWSASEVHPRVLGFEEAREEFDYLIEIVFREHMRSDVPFGLFLSGGLDSSIVLALLTRFGAAPVRSFSVGFDNVAMESELSEAGRMAALFGARHREILLDKDQIFRALPFVVWAADDLIRDYACLPTAHLAQAAAEELKVVFTGEGGDEVFAGYGRYRAGRLERWLKNLRSPGSGGLRTRGQWRGRWPEKVFGRTLRRQAQAFRRPFVAAWQGAPKGWGYVRRAQYTELLTVLPDDLLVKVDRMLMGHGLEGRVPFLDHRLVEFGLSLPDELKIRSGFGKIFLRRWAEAYLPRDHIWLKKRGFHVPIGHWLGGLFLDRLEERLLAHRGIRVWFRPEGIRELVASQRQGKDATREIWSLMQFAIWYNLFIEGRSCRPSMAEDPLDWI
ncbi:asparagine synthase (glutamine-hydrolyzing) [Thermosulfuriphilus sp.]